MTEEKAVIQVRNLVVKYDERTIINDISFDVNRGEIFVILGGSGSGKTTVMNQIIGLQKPAQGEICIAGEDIVTAFGEGRQNILRKFGVMYQGGALFGSMNLIENVRFPLEEFTKLPIDAMNSIAVNKLCMVGLEDFVTFMPAELSGGMRKRAAIARAMVLDPQILFLDEPSAGLDPIISAQLDKLIIDLAAKLGITFVVVSHELPSINAIADRVIMLHEGKIAATGDPRTLAQKCDNVFVRKFFARET